MKKKFFVMITSFVVLIISAISVSACFVGPPSDVIKDVNQYNYFARDYNRAEAIFEGKVIEKNRFRIKFKVSKVWKGNVPNEFVMSSGPIPYGNGEVVMISSCDYDFSVGENYLVYAHKKNFSYEFTSEDRYGKIPEEYKTLLWTSKSSRTKPLSDAVIGINNLTRISNGQNFKLTAPDKHSASIFRPADNHPANF
jgi:hypothetical protein